MSKQYNQFRQNLFQVSFSDAVHVTMAVSMFYLSCQNDHLCFCSPHIRSADHCQGASQLVTGDILIAPSALLPVLLSIYDERLKPEMCLSLTMWSETRYPSIKFGLILLSSTSEYIKLI